MGRLLDIRALGEVLAEVLAFIHEIEFPHVGEVMCCRGTSFVFCSSPAIASLPYVGLLYHPEEHGGSPADVQGGLHWRPVGVH